MTADLQIKQFEMCEQEALLSFLQLAYTQEPHKSSLTFWKWRFLENPHVRPDNIPLWIVKCGDTIVGQVSSTPVVLKIGNETMPALWSSDYYLLPEYRRGGLALGLLRAFEKHCPMAFNLGFNEKAEPVMRSLRWKFLGNINRYHLLLFPGNASKDIGRFAPVRQLANFLYTPIRRRLVGTSTAGGELRELTGFDSSFDDLWQEASAQWPCAVIRSSRFLQWQFMKQPQKKYTVLGYYDRGRLSGYIILFFRKGKLGVSPKVSISDLCYSPVDSSAVINSLLKGALQLAAERQAGAIVTDVLDNLVETRLRLLGFRHIKRSPAFAAKTVVHEDLVYERANWFLTRGDSDVSIFERPNL